MAKFSLCCVHQLEFLMQDLATYTEQAALKARQAAIQLNSITGAQKLKWLQTCAAALVARTDEIVEANARDLAAGEQKGLSAAMLDRLRLTPDRLQNLADAVVQIGNLPDPVG